MLDAPAYSVTSPGPGTVGSGATVSVVAVALVVEMTDDSGAPVGCACCAESLPEQAATPNVSAIAIAQDLRTAPSPICEPNLSDSSAVRRFGWR